MTDKRKDELKMGKRASDHQFDTTKYITIAGHNERLNNLRSQMAGVRHDLNQILSTQSMRHASDKERWAACLEIAKKCLGEIKEELK